MSDDMLSLLLLMRAWKSEKALNHVYKKQNDPKHIITNLRISNIIKWDFPTMLHCLKMTENVSLDFFFNLAFSTNFCPI